MLFFHFLADSLPECFSNAAGLSLSVIIRSDSYKKINNCSEMLFSRKCVKLYIYDVVQLIDII